MIENPTSFYLSGLVKLGLADHWLRQKCCLLNLSKAQITCQKCHFTFWNTLFSLCGFYITIYPHAEEKIHQWKVLKGGGWVSKLYLQFCPNKSLTQYRHFRLGIHLNLMNKSPKWTIIMNKSPKANTSYTSMRTRSKNTSLHTFEFCRTFFRIPVKQKVKDGNKYEHIVGKKLKFSNFQQSSCTK